MKDKGKGDNTVRVPAWALGTVIPTRSRHQTIGRSKQKSDDCFDRPRGLTTQ